MPEEVNNTEEPTTNTEETTTQEETTTNTFPSFRKAYKYRGGFDKFVYDNLGGSNGGGSASAYDDTELKAEIKTLQDTIDALESRIAVLEAEKTPESNGGAS